MKTWEDFKKEAKKIHPQIKADIEEIEKITYIIYSIIERRNKMGLSQRDLASKCNLPQSTIARVESLFMIPRLDTLLKIIKPLNLDLTLLTH